MKGLIKKEKGLMDMDNSVVIAGEGGIVALNGNVKHTIKKLKIKEYYNISMKLLLMIISWVGFL